MNQNKIKIALFVGLALVALFFRTWNLDNWPGINGDEAWYGIWAQNYLQGSSRELTTPTGNPINGFYAVPLIVTEYLSDGPQFVNLRIPALLSGLLLLLLVIPLMKKILGRDNAILLALLLACLPHLIGYSRFGWDACQTPWISLICVYFAFNLKPVLDKKNILMAIACILALWVANRIHPTNKLLVFIMMAPFIGECLKKYSRYKWSVLYFVGGLLLFVVLWAFLFPTSLAENLDVFLPQQYSQGAAVVSRIQHPLGFVDALQALGRLLTGGTLFHYITGPLPENLALVFDISFWLLVSFLLFVGGRAMLKNKEYAPMALLVGVFVTLLIYYFVMGPQVFTPNFERYTVFFIVPSCVCFVLLIRYLPYKTWLVIGLSTVFLFLFHSYYLTALKEEGGLGHRTSRTAEIEPKEKAYQLILENAGPNKEIVVLTEDWWTYQPIRYLGINNKKFSINKIGSMLDYNSFMKEPSSFVNKNLYAVGFDKRAFTKILRPSLWQQVSVISDPKQRPILYVWKFKQR